MSDSDVRERLGELSAKASAAHKRIDNMEAGLRSDLKEIKDDLRAVIAWMNRGKGWAAASLLIAGMAGGLIAEAAKAWMQK